MFRIRDNLGADEIWFCYVQTKADLREVKQFVIDNSALGIDTESTGVNCYKPGWELRTTQIANADVSYVIPARFRQFVAGMMRQPIKWIGHNGPHDIRSIDEYLGYATGIVCAGETYIPAHHVDSRKREDGGVGHGLKEQAIRHVSRDAGKWEVALKKAFKEIEIPIAGQTYKSGPRKGKQKFRKAKLSEGWSLIDPTHPAYIAYAAADPLLTYRLWKFYQPVVREFYELYQFDKRVQSAVDKLQRRAIRLDVDYTERLSTALLTKAQEFMATAAEYGCKNINSGQQVARVILDLGGILTVRTPTGGYKTDGSILREIAKQARAQRDPESGIDAPESALHLEHFIHAVLGAKQLLKRRESYTEQMLEERDADGRVHPSINALAARTARMSVSSPPLQQLPTKDREEDAS
jgi:DNA polymerase-1